MTLRTSHHGWSRSRGARVTALALVGAAVASCTPPARPLVGSTPSRAVTVPRLELPSGRQRVVFRWRYEEQDGPSARGDGVARIAAPDSARLDFYLEGGFAGGYAVLLGDRLSVPGGAMVERAIPPAPLLWAALGRLHLPAARDTTIRTSGDTLRADVGDAPTFRVTLVGSELRRVERIEGGRIVESLVRDPDAVRYRNEAARRTLAITITRTEPADAFPAAIWRR